MFLKFYVHNFSCEVHLIVAKILLETMLRVRYKLGVMLFQLIEAAHTPYTVYMRKFILMVILLT